MELKGKLKVVQLPVSYGKENKQKQMFVVEYTVGGGTKLAAFTVFAKGMEAISGIKLGSEVLVKFGVESREWQGKYYTDCIAFDVTATAAPKQEEPKGGKVDVSTPIGGYDDSLPF